jgi:hypothetical protein
MFATSIIRSVIRLVPHVMVLALAGVSVACNSDGPEDEPEVQTIRLVIGTQTIDIDRAAATPTITIAIGAHNVTATFLRANGDIEPLVNATEFEIRLEGMNASIATFTHAGAFAGTLTGVAAGSTNVTVQLYHKVEAHADFEKSVMLTVTG